MADVWHVKGRNASFGESDFHNHRRAEVNAKD